MNCRVVPDSPHYLVTRSGVVWSGAHRTWRRLKLQRTRGGYLVAVVRSESRYVRWAVHRLVLTAFVGPCPDGMEGCHNDGNPENNHADNLRWDTPAANHADKKKHGTQRRGDGVPGARLTDSSARSILAALARGLRVRDVAASHGVSHSAVSNIRRGVTWRHLTAHGQLDSGPKK